VHQELRGDFHCEPILAHSPLHPGTVARCLRALRRHRPDVVIGNTRREPSWNGIVARILGIPFVFRQENNAPYPDTVLGRLLFGWVPAVHIVNSLSTRSTVLASAPWLPPERVVLIPNGIDLAQIEGARPADLGLPEGALLFGFVGRFQERKGIRELAHAWKRVVTALPDAHLALVGWGNLETEARNILSGVGNVHWLGQRQDVPSLMKTFDVLVAPFRREAFGLVLVEAMAAGTPVICERTGSIPEIVDDGVEGVLIPPRDVEALSSTMIALGRDTERRAALGANGPRRARDFTLDQMINAHEDLLLEIVARRSHGAKTCPP